MLDSLDLTMDDNKENQTPEDVQQHSELDWVQQYSLDQEREEQELQQALAQSLQEHVWYKVVFKYKYTFSKVLAKENLELKENCHSRQML